MRVARRIIHALLLVLTLLVGATAAAIIVSQTAWFKDWLRGYIVSEAGNYLNGQLSIGRLGGNLFFGVELENVGVTLDGDEVVAVENLGLDYNVFQLISKGLSVDNVSLNHPTIYLRREGDTWSIARLVKKQEQEADREGPQFPIAIDDIGIANATLVIDDPVGTSGVEVPDRIERIDAKLAFKYEPVRYSIEISHVSFRASNPELELNALSGGVSVKDDTLFVEKLALRTAESSVMVDGAVQHYLSTPQLNLQITSDKLALSEVARLVPSVAGINLQPAFELKLNGPLDRLGVDMNVRSAAGQVVGQLVADLQAPDQAIQGDVRVRHLDLAPLLKDASQKSDLTADLHADLRGSSFSNLDALHGTLTLRADHLAAAGYAADRVQADTAIDGRRLTVNAKAIVYGSATTARGRITVPTVSEPLAFDLRGRAAHVSLARLPRALNAPPVATDITADYHASGSIPRVGSPRRITADATFAESTVPGARIAPGSTAGVTMNGTSLGYRANADLTGVDLQQVGSAFNVPALADPRYRSVINLHVTGEGSGTTPAALNLTARGTVRDTELLGGRIPELAFDAAVAHDTAHVTASGTFTDVNPAVASGRAAVEGTVAGSLDADVTVTGVSTGITASNLAGTARVNLEPSVIGGLALDSASLDAEYRDQTGTIRSLEVAGRDVNVKGSGTVALDDSGQSRLTVHADSPRLEEIARLFDVPVSGIVKVDATVTGNRTELQAQGTLSADGLKYEEHGALSADSTFTVKVPDLTFARAAVNANTKATFVTVAGQNINEVSAVTTYADKTVTFDASAAQPQRNLQAAGTLVLHPDHQEVHLTKLALAAGQQQWVTADDSTPTVNYAADAIAVEDLRLRSGDQLIAADGRFGQPGDALTLTLTNIDLAGVDALLLREPQFTGRLEASALITGTKTEPAASGTFSVSQGGFRQFKYESFGGSVNYRPAGLTLDTRLQQNATQWITVKGYVPSTTFRPVAAPAAGDVAGHTEPSSTADGIDLTVESSPLDLGLVQGFTTAVKDVRGTVEAHVRVTGSAQDPHPSGSLQVANGGMTLVETGVTYSNIAGKVDLQPDRVHIDQITVLDNHQNYLSVTGDLAVHARDLGGFQIWVNADDFKVIDNKMGNVRIQTAMSLSGQLRSPIVQGYLGVTTGEINLDEIIAMLGASPYPTTAAGGDAGNTTAVIAQAVPAPSSGTPFDALRMNLNLTVPNDLIVKASSLQTPGSPVSLGALNVTLGGELTATKDPGSAVRLVGAVNTIRGTYDFQGRRFEILRDGTIRFEGLDQISPTLDIRTRRIIQGVEARVNVRGTIEKPEIILSSTPPLEDADILSLIVFNQPLNQLGEGQQVSLAQRAQSLAAGAVAGQLAQSIGNALNLDMFEINVAPENGGGPELTLGQQVGQNLYVKVQQGIGDQSTTNFILEYEIARWLRLQTNIMQGSSTQQSVFRRAQGSGADLIFTFSY
ncbi:MAG TPA: translocation/assembly module TamB domain-containing protein [Vicinamibacterales bacterium]|nr:translocation/assembly module TamB domain-containing protein [Vicinamibacterales bacterium]